MQWENLTSQEFETAVQEIGICIISFGVIEKHGDHLPLGTDLFNGHKIACLAAEKEPAVVFPPFYFGQIFEAKCFPGTISLRSSTLTRLILEILDEVGRNGFKKIILYNAHGGNNYLLPFITQCSIEKETIYSLYYFTGEPAGLVEKELGEIFETHIHGHACELETSLSLANFPQLVRMDRVPNSPAEPLERLKEVPSSFTALSWYANFPDHYSGDARAASIEKGVKVRNVLVDSLAAFIANVKNDQTLPQLSKDFNLRVRMIAGVGGDNEISKF